MNAQTPHATLEDTERAERHMRMCRRLAELSMDLAEAAAALARTDLAEQANPSPTPQAEAQPQPPRPDATARFLRLAGAVRHAIALEARIAAGITATRPPRTHRPDARRPIIRAALVEAAGPNETLRLLACERLNQELADDPDQEIPPETLAHRIADDFGLILNPTALIHPAPPPTG